MSQTMSRTYLLQRLEKLEARVQLLEHLLSSQSSKTMLEDYEALRSAAQGLASQEAVARLLVVPLKYGIDSD